MELIVGARIWIVLDTEDAEQRGSSQKEGGRSAQGPLAEGETAAKAAVMRARPLDSPKKAIQGRARIQRPLLDGKQKPAFPRLPRTSEYSVSSLALSHFQPT